jgi:hypothetical protein
MKVYGLLAEFAAAEHLVEAARKTREAGYRRIDAISPFPLSELDAAMDIPKTRVPLVFLVGGIFGALFGFGLQCYACVYSYRIDVGGRPLYSWPAFIPITFEFTILCAGVIGAIGMLIMNGLPQPYHPLFNVPEFDLASQTRFFLVIEAADENFDTAKTTAFLAGLHPSAITEVPQ